MSSPVAAPHPPRSRAAGPLAVLVVLSVLLGASGFLSSPAPSGPEHRAAELVGADGHREAFTFLGGDVTLETTHSKGGPLLSSGPHWLALAEQDMENLLTGDFLRVSRTQRTLVRITRSMSMQRIDEQGVSTAAELGDDGLRVFRPALLVLPADVQPGDTWHGSGDVMSTTTFEAVESLEYTFDAAASVPMDATLQEAGCLTVERSENRDGQVTASSTTWCPGRGVVLDGRTGAGPLPRLATDVTASRDRAWEPTTWKMFSAPLKLAPPMQWGTDLAPVSVDGALVLAHQASGDLIFMPGGGPDHAWRVHPGGSVMMLSSFGNMVVASTTQSRLVAWDGDGVPGWEVETRDLVSLPPVLLDDTLVLASDSGHLMGVDVRTGEETWHTPLGEQLSAPPLACGTTVLVATTGPRLLALAADGSRLWERDLQDRADAVSCTDVGVALAVGGARLHHFSLDSTPLASVPLRVGVVDALWEVGAVVVAQSDNGLSAHDPARGMAQVWQSDHGVIDAVTDGEHLITLGPTGFTALDASGATIAEWAADAASPGSAPRLVPDVDAVRVLGADMILTELR